MNTTRVERKTKRREAAEARAILRADRSDQEQLDILTGRGFGDCREAVVLKERIKKNDS